MCVYWHVFTPVLVFVGSCLPVYVHFCVCVNMYQCVFSVCVGMYVYVQACMPVSYVDVCVSVCVCQCVYCDMFHCVCVSVGVGMCREVLAHYVLGFTYFTSLNAVGQ